MKLGGNNKERGAALLSVLMVVVAMSVAAVTTLDALARSVSISKAGQFRSEAIWSVRSAEALGASYLTEIIERTSGRITVDTPGLGEPQLFSTPRFNVTAELRPAGNCFNLNALALDGDGASDMVNETQYQNYLALLRGAGLFESEVQKLADTLADWLDRDDVSRASGAESSFYAAKSVSYRSAGQRLKNISELNAIEGYTRELQFQLKDLICVYPTTKQNKLNINVLSPEQAPLLHALFSTELSVDAARGLIETRPVTGWLSEQEFTTLDEIQKIAEQARMVENISVTTEYFEMTVDLASSDQTAYGDYLFEAIPEKGVKTLWRREGGQR